jgi:hypothetical protein
VLWRFVDGSVENADRPVAHYEFVDLVSKRGGEVEKWGVELVEPRPVRDKLEGNGGLLMMLTRCRSQ